jgi:hypothetical protein
MIGVSSVYQTNTNVVAGEIIYSSSTVDLGSTPSNISLSSSVITGPGTYVVFKTASGIIWSGSSLSAGADLVGKINFQLPQGYAIQSAKIAANGLDAHLVVRRAAIAS